MPGQPIFRDKVRAALLEHGPMTKEEVADLLQLPRNVVAAAIKSARYRYPEQIFRAVGYKRPSDGHGSDVTVYAAEAGSDKPRNHDKRKRRLKAQAKYREKNRASINARHRARRARMAGKETAINVWAALAPKELRAAMTQAAA